MDPRSLWTVDVSCRRYFSAMILSLVAAAAAMSSGGGSLNASSPLLLLDPFDNASSSSSSSSSSSPTPSSWNLSGDDPVANASASASMMGDPGGVGSVVAQTLATTDLPFQSSTGATGAGVVMMTPAVAGVLVQEVSPWDVALCVTGTLVSCENALVIAVLFYTPALRAPMFILIGSLAAADLLAGLGLILNFSLAYLVVPGPPAGDLLALLSAGLLIAAFSASVLSVLAITVDRYLSLCNALTYHTERTVKYTYAMVALVWASCLALGAAPALGWNCLRDESACSVLRPVTRGNAVALAGAFLAVFALMAQFYLQICKIAFRHAQQIAVQHQFLAISTTKGVSTLTAILCVFGACWLPLALYAVVADRTYPPLWTYAAALPAAACSAVNPVVYAFRNPDIQKSLWVACCGCLSHNLSLRPRTSSDV